MSLPEWAYCRSNRIDRRELRQRVKQLAQSDYSSGEQLLSEQSAALSETIRWAASHVPYYRVALSCIRANDRDLASIESLSKLPILRRDDFLSAGVRLYADSQPTNLTTYRSSGSSGQPVRTVHDEASRLSIWSLRERALLRFGLHAWSRHALIGSQRLSSLRRFAHRLTDPIFDRTRNGTFAFERPEITATCRRFSRFRPAVLVAQPSYLSRIVEVASETGHNLQSWQSCVALTIGEMLTPVAERTFAQAWGCRLLNEYGCTEVGAIAHCCPAGTLHLNPEHCIVELVDTAGRPVPPGVPGEVLLTALHNRAMPLIRYAVGDVATRAQFACVCGRQPGYPGLTAIEGRTRDVWLNDAGAYVSSAAWLERVQAQLCTAGFTRCQFVQHPGRGIEVRVWPNHAPPPDHLLAISQCLEPVLGKSVQVTWSGRPIELAPSGKMSVLKRADITG